MKKCKMRKPHSSDGIAEFEKLHAMIKERLHRYRDLCHITSLRVQRGRLYWKICVIEHDLSVASMVLVHLRVLAKNGKVPDQELVRRYRQLKELRLPRIASFPQLRAWLARYSN